MTAPASCIRTSRLIRAEQLVDTLKRGAARKFRERGPQADEQKAADDAAKETIADLLEELDLAADERAEIKWRVRRAALAVRWEREAQGDWNQRSATALRRCAREVREG
jgi:hypothetical protein